MYLKIKKIGKILNKLFFIFIPIILTILTIQINQNYKIYGISNYERNLILLSLLSLSLTLFCCTYANSIRKKLFLIILGPYFIYSILVQTGFLTDRSKEIRIATQNIIKIENLKNKKIEILTGNSWDEKTIKKIVKIALFTPNIGNGKKEIKDLEKNQYAWKAIPEKDFKINKNYLVISEDPIIYPWKLIIKK